jgi:UDP-N-acetylmuramoyl-tripeptide--D-alanyl-D-alanine ligase
MQAGSLFVAIAGERFDGNDFVPAAEAAGASGALVSRVAESQLPQIEVDDTRIALGRMANAWRSNFSIPVIGVTGSAGKTTVKELIAGILGIKHRVCVTAGNLNNEIGLPLTLLRLEQSDQALVVELGANHAGEIAYLAGLAEPTIGVITNAGAAHLEGFGSVAGVAAAKGELLDALPRAGTSVLNADDPYFHEWHARARTEQTLSFGFSKAADCRPLSEPLYEPARSCFDLRLPDGETLSCELPLLGRMNVVNSLAAAAAATAAGVAADEIAEGLRRIRPVQGRMSLRPGIKDATIIDDSYNANPSAARAALDFLASRDGRRIFVLGDMLELGAEEVALHEELGDYARDCCDSLFAVGRLAAHAAAAFGAAGRSFDGLDQLFLALNDELVGSATVLVKGSRAMGLEQLVARLVVHEGAKAC